MADPLDNPFATENWAARRDLLYKQPTQLPSDVPSLLAMIQEAYEKAPVETRDSVVVSWSDEFSKMPGLHIFHYDAAQTDTEISQ